MPRPTGPFLRSEFVIEDLILLLALESYVVPFRFKRLIGLLIACLLSTAMALIRTPASSKVSLAFFALLGLHSATLALIELFRLRRRGLDVILPPD